MALLFHRLFNQVTKTALENKTLVANIIISRNLPDEKMLCARINVSDDRISFYCSIFYVFTIWKFYGQQETTTATNQEAAKNSKSIINLLFLVQMKIKTAAIVYYKKLKREMFHNAHAILYVIIFNDHLTNRRIMSMAPNLKKKLRLPRPSQLHFCIGLIYYL